MMARKKTLISFNHSAEQDRAIRAFRSNPVPLRVYPQIQNYNWGERGENAYIPGLLRIPPGEGTSYAELWIGAHPLMPAKVGLSDLDRSMAGSDARMDLSDLIDEAPRAILGGRTARRYGRQLPFLMKVLSASKALSIQTHPGKLQARKGFSREELLGIPRNAENRVYRDQNHKPELIIALSDFYALDRFRPLKEIVSQWQKLPELESVIGGVLKEFRGFPPKLLQRKFLKKLYGRCMSMEQTQVNHVLGALTARLHQENDERPFTKMQIESWLLKADLEYSRGDNKDRGLFSFYLLNLMRLRPGEACYLESGELHTYLEGVGIEVMANSDNVIRGGLTSKHVDVPELLNTLTFNMGAPARVAPDRKGVYRTPAREFEVEKLEISRRSPARFRRLKSAEMLLTIKGEAEVQTAGGSVTIGQGEVALVPAALGRYRTISKSAIARLYRCTISG